MLERFLLLLIAALLAFCAGLMVIDHFQLLAKLEALQRVRLNPNFDPIQGTFVTLLIMGVHWLTQRENAKYAWVKA